MELLSSDMPWLATELSLVLEARIIAVEPSFNRDAEGSCRAVVGARAMEYSCGAVVNRCHG